MEENNSFNQQIPEESFDIPEAEIVPEATPDSDPEAAPKKKKKKVGLILGIIGGVVALAILAVVLIFVIGGNKNFTRKSFIKDIGGVSETFTGALSEDSYGSAEEAAEEYVYHEIIGDIFGVSINSVRSQGTVDATDIIPRELLEGSNGVEKLEVEFSRSESASVSDGIQAVSYDGGRNESVEVYVINYGTQWKYFAPMPDEGEVLNQSYFDSIFGSEKYRNCTFEIVKTTKSGAFGIGMNDATVTWLIKLQEGKLYMEQTVVSSGLNKIEETLNFYLENTGDGEFRCYVQENGGEWRYSPNTTIGFYNGLYRIYAIDEFTPFFDHLEFDHSYFRKTEYGFEVPEEKTTDYFLDTYYWRELSRMLGNEGMSPRDEDVDVKELYAEYFVQDGALTGMRMKGKIDFTVDIEGMKTRFNYKSDYVAKITNYGTTVVESPVD